MHRLHKDEAANGFILFSYKTASFFFDPFCFLTCFLCFSYLFPIFSANTVYKHSALCYNNLDDYIAQERGTLQ